jgi:signal transduction histidine kinase
MFRLSCRRRGCTLKGMNIREQEITDYTAWKKQIREEFYRLKQEALDTIPRGEDATVVIEEPVAICPWL